MINDHNYFSIFWVEIVIFGGVENRRVARRKLGRKDNPVFLGTKS
jgi:hypothetical protein